MPDQITIPETIEQATAALGGLDRLLTAKKWERAAIVYAFTRDSRSGERVDLVKPHEVKAYTPNQFAQIGITGLRDHNVVRHCRRQWKAAIEQGKAQHIEPGDTVKLPDLAWTGPGEGSPAYKAAKVARLLADPAVAALAQDAVDKAHEAATFNRLNEAGERQPEREPVDRAPEREPVRERPAETRPGPVDNKPHPPLPRPPELRPERTPEPIEDDDDEPDEPEREVPPLDDESARWAAESGAKLDAMKTVLDLNKACTRFAIAVKTAMETAGPILPGEHIMLGLACDQAVLATDVVRAYLDSDTSTLEAELAALVANGEDTADE